MNKFQNITKYADLTQEEIKNEIAVLTIEIDRLTRIRKEYLLEDLKEHKENLKNLLTQLKLRGTIHNNEDVLQGDNK